MMTRDELCLKASLLFDAGLGMCAARLDRPLSGPNHVAIP